MLKSAKRSWSYNWLCNKPTKLQFQENFRKILMLSKRYESTKTVRWTCVHVPRRLSGNDFPIDKTFHLIYDIDTELDIYRIASGFHGTFVTGAACQQGTLILSDTCFCPFLGLAYAPIETSFHELAVFLPDYSSYISRYFLNFAYIFSLFLLTHSSICLVGCKHLCSSSYSALGSTPLLSLCVMILLHRLVLALLGHQFSTFKTTSIWLRVTDKGAIPEMRIWPILLMKSDLKWCIHIKRDFY